MASHASPDPSSPEATASLDAQRRALASLRKLKRRVAELESAQHAPIAIVGLGCRMPGGISTPEQFWDALTSGRDLVTEIPATRWPVDDYYDPDPDAPGRMNTRWGGFCADLETFDHGFFGLTRHEAERLDPQQRMLLEVSWEALERSGVDPRTLAGSSTGVFVGVATADYLDLQMREATFADAVRKKLILEIAARPEDATVILERLAQLD